jgi:hypothetical protein
MGSGYHCLHSFCFFITHVLSLSGKQRASNQRGEVPDINSPLSLQQTWCAACCSATHFLQAKKYSFLSLQAWYAACCSTTHLLQANPPSAGQPTFCKPTYLLQANTPSAI